MGESATRAEVYDLPASGAVLVLYTQQSARQSVAVAAQVDGLLAWLGVPAGFTVYLWMRDDPRRLGRDEWPNRRNVNGGWTIPGTRAIFVYRAEEYERVVIHETIHALEWDWVMPSTPLKCWKFQDGATVSPHLFEAWTELYAEWLYCGYFNVPWAAQREWQTYQAVQILARRNGDAWKEDTNVFAYYVLKAALAPHMAFLWMFGNGKTAMERHRVLCEWVSPELDRLKALARTARKEPFSLRMTRPKK